MLLTELTVELRKAARQAIDRFVQWYNHGRPHSSVDKVPPIEAYYALLPALKTAA